MNGLRDAIDHTMLGWIKPELDEVLRQNEGEAEVVLVVARDGATTRMRSRSRRVVWNEESAAEIEAVVGAGHAWLDAKTDIAAARAENVAA